MKIHENRWNSRNPMKPTVTHCEPTVTHCSPHCSATVARCSATVAVYPYPTRTVATVTPISPHRAPYPLPRVPIHPAPHRTSPSSACSGSVSLVHQAPLVFDTSSSSLFCFVNPEKPLKITVFSVFPVFNPLSFRPNLVFSVFLWPNPCFRCFYDQTRVFDVQTPTLRNLIQQNPLFRCLSENH